MIAIGYLLTKISWIDKKGAQLFSKLVVNVSLPALMINNLMNNF